MEDKNYISDSYSGGLPDNSFSSLHRHKQFWSLERCALVFSILLNGFLVLSHVTDWARGYAGSRNSYENGFESDLASIKGVVETYQTSFQGGVTVDDHGQFSVNRDGEEYAGEPSPTVDEAWNTILAGINLDLEESDSHLHNTFRWPESGLYFTGLEVFHSLHCLNRLRQALHPEYYQIFNHSGDPSQKDHITHCINHLRQSIQCHADLTPMEWERVGNKIILKTDTMHTCRNFEKVHAWAAKRRTRFEDIQVVQNGTLFVVD